MNYAVLICPFFILAMGHYISKTDLLRCPWPCATLSTPMGIVVLGRVQRCPRPWATLSSAVNNAHVRFEERTAAI